MKRVKNKEAIKRKKRVKKAQKLREKIDKAENIAQLKKAMHEILDVVEA